MDIFEKCRQYTIAREAMKAGIYPYFVPFDDNEGTIARLHGREIVMCGSNNYLGLTKDPRVIQASHAALDESGSSCTGSRLLNGNLRLHEELESELASFFGKPAALVFPTGYQANVGAISGLLSRGDTIFADREAHASALDGALVSPASLRLFAHNDADDLRAKLAARRPGGASLVVVDGVYSMGGDLCELEAIVEVCNEFGARLIVDDAHGAGVLGGGRGTCAELGLADRVDLITVTFSKAFASLGGAIVGDEDVIHYLRHHARTEIFSASMTPSNTAAALTALRICTLEPWRSQQALANARYVDAGFASLGLDTGNSRSPIVPVITTEPYATARLWSRLMELGVYTNAVLPPAASTRLRTSFMATHSRAQIDYVLEAFGTVCDEGLIATDSSAA